MFFSLPVMSNSLQPHGLQHAKPSCLLPSPRVCARLCPVHRWYHPAIWSSDVLFSFRTRSFPASGTFSMSFLFASDDQNTGASASASVLPKSIQILFPWRSLLFKGQSDIFTSTTIWGHQFFGALPSLWYSFQVQPYLPTGKTVALTIRTFVGRVMSLLFNTLSRFVIVFLPSSNCLLI